MEYQPGLEGVIAAETEISYLDVDHEEIVVRGYDLIDLAHKRSYAEVAYLILHGRLPEEGEARAFEQALLEARVPEAVFAILRLLPEGMHPMDRLRTLISALGGFEAAGSQAEARLDLEAAPRLIGQAAILVANLQRENPRHPEPGLSFPAAFLGMITGQTPTAEEARAFDQLLIAYSEHEMPNSTFAARVIASTLADLYGAVTGAVASLKGPLHGGANEAVMEMLLEAGTAEGLERLILERLGRKERIMGFGHRVYMRRMDPRAALMKEVLGQLAQKGNQAAARYLEVAVRGEEVMQREKGLYPNLDYYAAPVLYALGVPVPLYTPIFLAARAAGLVAHVAEQHAHNRLFRPRVLYKGPRGFRA
ncbi:citrate synthase [Meiothermus sp. QL-1]|uniref:citrate/2-methylcitrate synthase n=1 Tax=Meiothermus sp. QL-1 TaxID=2058095 RepID=UPI000E0A1017|nr:citrate/2-methylcitrate synthase [Meiothermus sp. QL-1]RDI96631.1 citrate synthase [Meiothermus sp. QL-1]